MTLYAVYNGWHANEPVHVLVEADSAPDARVWARRLLRDEDGKRRQPHGTRYWSDLRVEVVTLPQISEGAPMGTVVSNESDA